MDWNIHHGIGTDGRYDINRIADWIVKTGANVVSLNEVEKYEGGYGNEDQPARFASMLRSTTVKTWYYKFAQRDGNTNGQGNLLLTTFAIESKDGYELSYSRSVARIAVIVNGIRVNLYSTHLDADSSSRRATDDSWAMAVSQNIDVAYSGNTAGNTRNSRIDYIFHSKGATRLRLRKVQVFDVRNSSGGMPDGDVQGEIASSGYAGASREPPAYPLRPAGVSPGVDRRQKY